MNFSANGVLNTKRKCRTKYGNIKKQSGLSPASFCFIEKRIWENQKKQRNAVPCFFLFMAAESRQEALSVLYIRKRGIHHGRYSV